ncbi:hypothetical protein ACPW7J_07850 [Ihubacter sp. rT4E-8]|uniref:hypothetical protein n=1 Tax=unclassified Ihubacter TaxID=2633299 RepID=UPI003C7D35CE
MSERLDAMDNEKNILQKEIELEDRLARLQRMEREIKAKEKAVKQAEKAKKQIILRIAPSLWEEIARWAEEDFRSINGQIEYLLSECVRERKSK